MTILFEDRHIVVCEKPAGVSSQLSPDGKDMISLLTGEGRKEIYPVHRLDAPTAGVMVYAETKQAAAFLSKELAENRFEKDYLALVHGALSEPEGEMEDLLYRDKQKNKTFVVKRERKGVKKARLAYKTEKTLINEKGELSLVRVRLFTGRTHQIRVQFASRKHPLAGDGKYGARDNIKDLGLCCVSIGFTHPVTGEKMNFALKELPEYFRALIE